LNSLQSNASVIDAIRKSGNFKNEASIPEMKSYMKRLGYQVKDLNRLNVIHVAGTKGKGSTSAFCESILRKHQIKDGVNRGIKTGLYTSPHLLEVRERIRIDGQPISKELFTRYFFEVWDRLEQQKVYIFNKLSPEEALEFADKPGYFRFLTLVSLHAFMQENVDAAILEVGIGGEYDSTNIVESPTVCGITSLGIDHVAVLGNTIDKIAWHKAGIIKKNCPVISSPQLPEAINVIQARAKEIGASSLKIMTAQEVGQYKTFNLGLKGDHQRFNASLANELCKEWIKAQKANGIVILGNDSDIKKGLEDTKWAGRCQEVVVDKYPSTKWFLDGAHTAESLSVCAQWFNDICKQESKKNVLMFNCTHGRQGSTMFPPLLKVFGKGFRFEKIVFTTNNPWKDPSLHEGADLMDLTVHPDPELLMQKQLKETFILEAAKIGIEYGNIEVFSNVESAIEDAADSDRVLITGSLYLVGSSMTVLGIGAC
jgi:folylpolyglutamate synthase